MFILPLSVDLTPKGKLVMPEEELADGGYAENVEYTLQILPNPDGIHVEYYGEDDTFLDEEQIHKILKHTIKRHHGLK